MLYLAIAPGLICGLALAVSDVRSRRVPLPWVAIGTLVELAAVIIYAIATHNAAIAIHAIILTVVCTIVQLALALAVPHALGLGDVFAILPIGLAVGMLGLEFTLSWWLIMGLLGIIFIAFWTRTDPQRRTPYAGKVPFVPVIWSAALCTVLISVFA